MAIIWLPDEFLFMFDETNCRAHGRRHLFRRDGERLDQGHEVMSKLVFILPLAGLLVGGSALAAETVGGVVSQTDPAMGTVSIVGGGTYRVSQPELLRGVYSGEHVIITMNDNHTVGLQEDSSFSDSSVEGH